MPALTLVVPRKRAQNEFFVIVCYIRCVTVVAEAFSKILFFSAILVACDYCWLVQRDNMYGVLDWQRVGARLMIQHYLDADIILHVSITQINVKMWFVHELTANDTSKTAKITKM